MANEFHNAWSNDGRCIIHAWHMDRFFTTHNGFNGRWSDRGHMHRTDVVHISNEVGFHVDQWRDFHNVDHWRANFTDCYMAV